MFERLGANTHVTIAAPNLEVWSDYENPCTSELTVPADRLKPVSQERRDRQQQRQMPTGRREPNGYSFTRRSKTISKCCDVESARIGHDTSAAIAASYANAARSQYRQYAQVGLRTTANSSIQKGAPGRGS